MKILGCVSPMCEISCFLNHILCLTFRSLLQTYDLHIFIADSYSFNATIVMTKNNVLSVRGINITAKNLHRKTSACLSSART